MNTRALKNPYPDYDGNPALTQHLFDSQGKLTPEFAHRLSAKVSELLAVMENGLRSPDADGSCYTGWTGIALLYLHLHNVFREPLFLEKANMYISYSLKCFRQHQDFTFLCGVAGALAVAAVVCYRLQRPQNSDEYISRLLQQHPMVVQPSAELSDELLYGRIGYLYALVYINQQLGQEKIPLQYIREVSKAVAASGERLSRILRIQNQSPLMYEWYQERYVGAAHGLAGIYYFLMQPGLAHSEEVVHRLVKPSVDYVCSLKFPSGNYPPCIGDERDLLVHWCHGAPGVVYMLLQAHRVLITIAAEAFFRKLLLLFYAGKMTRKKRVNSVEQNKKFSKCNTAILWWFDVSVVSVLFPKTHSENKWKEGVLKVDSRTVSFLSLILSMVFS